MKIKSSNYRWDDLSPVVRQYVVVDNNGRYGIAMVDHREDVIFAHPIDVDTQIGNDGSLALPSNAVIMTDTAFYPSPDGWRGQWYDQNVDVTLSVVSGLGIYMPDRIADRALAGSDQMGHWDYGAKLGKVGGEPPVKGQKHDEITIEQAVDYAREVGETITKDGVRRACQKGYIPARKIGRDWLLTYEGLNYYFDNRPKRGPKAK
jgi:hypothetical protein